MATVIRGGGRSLSERLIVLNVKMVRHKAHQRMDFYFFLWLEYKIKGETIQGEKAKRSLGEEAGGRNCTIGPNPDQPEPKLDIQKVPVIPHLVRE